MTPRLARQASAALQPGDRAVLGKNDYIQTTLTRDTARPKPDIRIAY